MHGRLEVLVAVPVAIGLLGDDAALDEQPFEDQRNIEFRIFRVPDTECNILEIAKQGQVGVAVCIDHESSNCIGGGRCNNYYIRRAFSTSGSVAVTCEKWWAQLEKVRTIFWTFWRSGMRLWENLAPAPCPRGR